jgi:hypothetical protein
MTKILTFTSLLFFFGCASNRVTDVNKLQPGLSITEVKQIMGEPSVTQMKNGQLIYKYSVWQAFVGNKPYYLIFSQSDNKLASWYADENEYWRNQNAWMGVAQEMNKQQRHDDQMRLEQQKLLKGRSMSCTSKKSVWGNSVQTNCEEY